MNAEMFVAELLTALETATAGHEPEIVDQAAYWLECRGWSRNSIDGHWQRVAE